MEATLEEEEEIENLHQEISTMSCFSISRTLIYWILGIIISPHDYH